MTASQENRLLPSPVTGNLRHIEQNKHLNSQNQQNHNQQQIQQKSTQQQQQNQQQQNNQTHRHHYHHHNHHHHHYQHQHNRSSFYKHLELIFVIIMLFIVFPIESSRSRKTNQELINRRDNVDLCSKAFDVKMFCHCTHDVLGRKIISVTCAVLNTEFPQTDSGWLAFRQHPNIEQFELTVMKSGFMSYLPSDILKYQKELRNVLIMHAEIREIPTYAFSNLTKLENVTLIRSQIEVLDQYAFANHPSLQYLNLEENQIVEIDRMAFSSLPELLELCLSRNNVTILHEGMFGDLGKLLKLKLNENMISILTREMFKGLGNIKVLDLSFNNVKFIGDTVFAELWSLQELDLDNNFIERLSERAFDGLNNLRLLSMKNNKIQMLESGVFTGVPALTTLNLNNNQLETLTYNNILPLLDNLVNSTSTLSISENKFICDCRLNWVFDVLNRTKNIELKRSMEKITCTLIKSPNHFIDSNGIGVGGGHSVGVIEIPPHAHKFGSSGHRTNQPQTPHDYEDYGDNDLVNNPHQQQQQQYNNHHEIQQKQYMRQQIHYPATYSNIDNDATSTTFKSHHHQQQQQQSRLKSKNFVELVNVGIENLPCAEELTDPTELPLSRESIGMDLSWLSGSATTCYQINTVLFIFISIIISFRLCLS